ncbi:MAG: carbon-nitrogen hydrolase family protein [Anaerolineae bacterium]|nr:carbon-nitrogen hydrolase family protein [Anaerolineae bacterium]
MSRKLKLAAIQMNAEPALAEARLARAASLVARAAEAGAQLVVLPEVFNTGYTYTDENYTRAEPLTGPTVTWMRQTAAQHRVYLVGTLFLLDREDIYNAMLLVGPEGQLWRYDKIYPWAWERVYFREGERITVAETPLGAFGMLVCWDSAHPGLWARYAGQVDVMLVCSCPPAVHDLTWIFPDGRRLHGSEIFPFHQHIWATSAEVFGAHLRRQAAALGVPVVNTTATGLFSTSVPLPAISLLSYTLGRPDFWRYLSQAEAIRVEAGYFHETYVADAMGKVLAQVPPGAEHFAIAEVTLPETRPQSRASQPAFGISPLLYLLDEFANALLRPVYRRVVRQVYGSRMAPLLPATHRWTAALALVGILSFWLGRRLRAPRN